MVGPERSAEQSCSGRDYFAAGWCDQNISLLRKLYDLVIWCFVCQQYIIISKHHISLYHDLDANNFVYGVSMCLVCSMHSESL